MWMFSASNDQIIANIYLNFACDLLIQIKQLKTILVKEIFQDQKTAMKLY